MTSSTSSPAPRHLAWGYVDQPPVVPAVAWFESHLFGSSVVALRILPALAGGGAVVCSGAMARELGGARKAQTLAALAGATSPQVLAACHLLSTTSFDLSLWAVLSLLVLVVLRTGDGRWWLAIGAVAGVALLTKLNVAFFLVALVVGLLLAGRRRLFASPWLWGGAAIAVAFWMPNILWNARHDWAALAMLRTLHAENGGLGASFGFIPSQLVVVGPVLVVFWIAGLRGLLRTPAGRPFGIAFLVLLGWFTVTGAKSYYLAGAYFVLFAAGGVWAERRLDRKVPPRGLRGWITLMVVGAVMAVPLALPVLPEHDLATGPWEGNINKDLERDGRLACIRPSARRGGGHVVAERARAPRRLHGRLRRRRRRRPVRHRGRTAGRDQRAQLVLVVGTGRSAATARPRSRSTSRRRTSGRSSGR